MKINPDLIWRKIENNVFIIDPKKNTLYELNETGSFIFQQIINNKTDFEILDSVCNMYDVSFEEAKKDFDELVERMVRWGIFYEE